MYEIYLFTLDYKFVRKNRLSFAVSNIYKYLFYIHFMYNYFSALIFYFVFLVVFKVDMLIREKNSYFNTRQ